jgi:hypothetical protein
VRASEKTSLFFNFSEEGQSGKVAFFLVSGTNRLAQTFVCTRENVLDVTLIGW